MIIAIKEKDRVIVALSNSDELRRVSVKDLTNEENTLIKIKDDIVYCFSMFSWL